MHYLPNYYPNIEKFAAPTAWIWDTDLDEAWAAASSLGKPPYLVKDHVKSAKEDWENCCLIPANADRKTFDRICQNFIEYRGTALSAAWPSAKFCPSANWARAITAIPFMTNIGYFSGRETFF